MIFTADPSVSVDEKPEIAEEETPEDAEETPEVAAAETPEDANDAPGSADVERLESVGKTPESAVVETLEGAKEAPEMAAEAPEVFDVESDEAPGSNASFVVGVGAETDSVVSFVNSEME